MTQRDQSDVLPAVQRYAIAAADLHAAQDRAAYAQSILDFERPRALRALKEAGIPPRQRIEGHLLGGRPFAMFYDEAGIVML